jgi:hypothetical protein
MKKYALDQGRTRGNVQDARASPPSPAWKAGYEKEGGGGVGQPKMCIPTGKILGTPLLLILIHYLLYKEVFEKNLI